MPQYTGQWWDHEKHAFWYQFFVPFVNTVRQRQGPGGRKLNYVTAQTVENRLDDLVGPSNWWDDYQVVGPNAVLCRLSIRTPWGEIVTKSDCGDMEMAGGEVNEKGGFSDALKRAAVKFGVGRHLYEDGLPLIYEDGIPPPTETTSTKTLVPPSVVTRILEGERTASVPEATRIVNELVNPPTAQKSKASFGSMPAAGPALPNWIRSVGDYYGVDIMAPAKRVAEKNGKSTNFGALDQADTNRVANWIINYCKKLDAYDNEFELLSSKMVETKRNVAWARACQFFGKNYPNETPPVQGDSRIKMLVSKITDGDVPDILCCDDHEKLTGIANILTAGLNGADILNKGA